MFPISTSIVTSVAQQTPSDAPTFGVVALATPSPAAIRSRRKWTGPAYTPTSPPPKRRRVYTAQEDQKFQLLDARLASRSRLNCGRSHGNTALRENSEKWPIGGDLSILPFQGFSTPATSASTHALGTRAVHPRFRGTPNPGCLGFARVAQI